MWRGKPLSELSREELLDAVGWLSKELDACGRRLHREIREGGGPQGQERAWIDRLRRRQGAR
jgi:hypothetical protein